MSRIGDAIKKAADDYSHTWSDSNEEAVVREVAEKYRALGAEGAQQYYREYTTHALRGVYLWMAGSEPFTGGENAMQRTEDQCMKALTPILVHAFSDGVQIGQGTLPVVKKFRFFKKVDEVFAEDSFRTESDSFALSVETDYEAMEYIEWYLRASASFMAAAGGYIHVDDEDPAALSRVWDVWGLAVQSCVAGMYLTGYQTGQTWKDDDVLEGILKASEES